MPRSLALPFVVVAAACLAAEGIPWRKDLAAAEEEARKAGKPLLVEFVDGNGWCLNQDERTWPDPEVVKLAGKYVCVRIPGPKHPDLVKRFAVKGYPTTILIDPKGQEVRRVDGFRGAERFRRELELGLKGDPTPAEALPAKPAPGNPAPQQGPADNPLPEMAARMGKVREKLEAEDTGKGTQEQERKIIEQLERMIEEAEQQGGG